MISKWINKLLLGFLAVAFLVAIKPDSSVSQVPPVQPTGKTEEQSSQIILWYDADEGNPANRDESLVTVTNGSFTDSVWVHVQIFSSDDLATCVESDFIDFYTQNDTHTYVMNTDNIQKNMRTLTGDPISTGIDVSFTKGFVVVTPIFSGTDFRAISFQHLFGNSSIEDDFPFDHIIDHIIESESGIIYYINAMGRDAVDLLPGGGILPDGTVLDGVTGAYVLLQPDILKFNFFTNNDELRDEADVVSIAFQDNYDGVFGAGSYEAQPADASWSALIFDTEEDFVSCDVIPQNCFFDLGINDEIVAANSLVNAGAVLCAGNDTPSGWVKIAVSGVDGLENELGIIGIINELPDRDTEPLEFSTIGGADWMHAE